MKQQKLRTNRVDIKRTPKMTRLSFARFGDFLFRNEQNKINTKRRRHKTLSCFVFKKKKNKVSYCKMFDTINRPIV